jgi:hypothetical protein
VVVVNGSVVAVPEVGWVPLHPPDAVQVCEFADDHSRSAVLPAVTVLLVAVKVSVGADWVPPVDPVLPLLVSEEAPPPQAASADRTIEANAQRSRWNGWRVGRARRSVATPDVGWVCIPETLWCSIERLFKGARWGAQLSRLADRALL